MKSILRFLVLLCAAIPVFAFGQTLSLTTNGTNTTSGTSSTLGSGSSAVSASVTFTCTDPVSTNLTSITVFNGAATSSSSFGSVVGQGNITYTTSNFQPGTDSVQCSSNGSLIGYSLVVAADPLRSFVVASDIVDASETPIVSGKLCFTPVNAFGQVTTFNMGGAANIRPMPVCRAVANGGITSVLMLARSDGSVPVGVNYSVAVTDNSTGQTQNLGTYSVTGGTWVLNNAAPSSVQTAPPAAWVPTINIGMVTALPAGSAPVVTDSGSSTGHVFNFSFPSGVGPIGPQGPIGITGPIGSTGSVGSQGSVGATGPQGAVGSAGPTGSTGPQGPAGLNGTGSPAGTVGTRQPAQFTNGTAFAADSSFGVVPSGSSKAGLVQLEASLAAFKGPRVNVLNTDFAGGADPTGATDSTAAIKAAIAYAVAKAGNSSGVGSASIYFPAGRYMISSTLTITGNPKAINIVGDGSLNTQLLPTASFSGAVLDITGAVGGGNYSNIIVKGIGILGTGHTTAATLLSITQSDYWLLDDVSLANTAGVCLELHGSAERGASYNLSTSNCRRAVVANGNTNEIYFHNSRLVDSGKDSSGYSWNVNAAGTGAIPGANTGTPVATAWASSTTDGVGYIVNDGTTNCNNGAQSCNWQVTATSTNTNLCTSGTTAPAWTAADGATVVDGTCTWTNISNRTILRPDYHAAVSWLSGQNIRFDGQSIKNTVNMGCFQFIGTDHFSTNNTYCEASGYPSLNPEIQIGGVPWTASSSTALPGSAGAQAVTLGPDGVYSPLYYGSQADMTTAGIGWGATLYPPDFVNGDTTDLSSICTGVSACSIYKGTTEGISILGVYGAATNGGASMSITTRGSTPYAWPAGYKVEIGTGQNPAAEGESYADHWNGMDGIQSGYAMSCSLTALTLNPTYGSQANTCGSILNGPIYNGTSVPTSTINQNQSTGEFSLEDEVTYTQSGYNSLSNEGWVVVSTNGNVNWLSPECLSRTNVNANPFAQYTNAHCQALFTQYPTGGKASVRMADIAGGSHMDSVTQTMNTEITQYAPNGGINRNVFWGARAFQSVSGAVEVTLTDGSETQGLTGVVIGNSSSPWLTVAANAVTPNVPLVPTKGIQEPVAAFYTGTLPYSIPVGQQLTRIHSTASGTVTFPPIATAVGQEYVLQIDNAGGQITLAAPSGSIQTPFTSFGSSLVLPTGFSGTIRFESDGASISLISSSFPLVSVSTGTSGCTLAADSTMQSGQITCTGAVAASGTIFSITPSKSLSGQFECSVTPQNANANAASVAGVFTTAPSNGAWSATNGATGMTAQTYTWGFSCQ